MANKIRRQLCEAMDFADQEGNVFEAKARLDEDFVGFNGHFPDEPVLPGICMITAVLVAAQKHLGCNLHIKTVKAAKFYSPARPGDSLTVKGKVEEADSGWRISGTITSDEERVGKVSLIAKTQIQECK